MSKEITVELDDRPGTLAELGETLGKANINIEAIAGFSVGGKGISKVLVEDAKAARQALEGVGIRVTGEKDVLIVKLDDRPGTIGAFARKLANAGVNIESSYIVCGRAEGEHVFTVSDLEKAKRAI